MPVELLKRCGSMEFAEQALRANPGECAALYGQVQRGLLGGRIVNVPTGRPNRARLAKT